ncbi:MAG: acetyl-CoA carboxylase carboxyltransferase subunit alpha [Candidatus Omnitrophica bacterium]|nr:acetyl-CoA carboxylase carboxyltransferase subunit alpha [Candidatus Omnitrophota bacterium]
MMLQQFLEFEKPVVELEKKIEELRQTALGDKIDSAGQVSRLFEIEKLSKEAKKLQEDIFSNLTPWQITQLARHPLRPYTLDYTQRVFTDFIELHGDRNFRDDPAIVGGLAMLENEPVMVIGHQKGRTTKEKVLRNFGMPNPEGYRKAIRLMSMAERLKKPIVTFIDTPGAFPGIGAEERGQAEAIAKNIMVMSRLKVPIIIVVIGEGGSGGALAIGVGDRVLMLEYSTYSVISPEGCAAILWKDGSKADIAAKALKITAKDLYRLEIIDEIIKEPLGGAHQDIETMTKTLKEALVRSLQDLKKNSPDDLVHNRYSKYRKIGKFKEGMI